MKAVIMAGGEGSRLRPLTSNTPKPMLPVANLPMMEHIVNLCRRHGMTEIVTTVQFLASVIRSHFGDGEEFGVSLEYAVEESPLGTAGSVGNARNSLQEPFLVISGDALTDIDLSAVVAADEARGSLATIVLYRAENPLEFGIVITREDGAIERFLEKPTWGQVFSDTVNTGIYVLDPRIFEFIPEGVSVDFSHDVFPKMLAEGLPIHGYVADGYWEDVGTIEAYTKAQRDVLDGRVEVEVPGFKVSEGVWIGEDVDVAADASITGPAVIGDNCRIGPGVNLREYTVLGNNTVVGDETVLTRSTVFDNAHIGKRVTLRGTVAGKGSDLREGVRAEPEVVIGDGCFVGDHAVLNQGVKVYPFRSVEAGAVVNTSVVWENRAPRNLFGRRGVRGLANVDITPQLAVRLAMAYGTSLKRGATVTASRDVSRAARTTKRAFVAGLNATGVNVDDLEIATVGVTRFQSRQDAGGFTIRAIEDDPQTLEIRFFASDGTDLSEGAQRKIERNFAREDFRRALYDEFGEISYPARARESYTRALLECVDAEAIRHRRAKVVVDYAFGTASLTMVEVLESLGVDVLAINPYTAEPGRRPAGADADSGSLGRLGDLVRASGSDFGLRFDTGAETARLVDDQGRPLGGAVSMLFYVLSMGETHPGGKFVLPVTATAHAERLALAAGCEVIWSQTSAPALMDAARGDGVLLAVTEEAMILPAFEPGFDAIAQFALTLELLAKRPGRMSEVVDRLPAVHLVHETVPTPWERKGAVMRSLVEDIDPATTELLDGVKVRIPDAGPGTWVLVLPDTEAPVCHIWAEAASDAAARSLASEWRARIQRISS